MGDRVAQFDRRTLVIPRALDVGAESAGLGSTPAVPRSMCHSCRPLANPRQVSLRRSKFNR
jgi:hypothetical protein